MRRGGAKTDATFGFAAEELSASVFCRPGRCAKSSCADLNMRGCGRARRSCALLKRRHACTKNKRVGRCLSSLSGAAKRRARCAEHAQPEDTSFVIVTPLAGTRVLLRRTNHQWGSAGWPSNSFLSSLARAPSSLAVDNGDREHLLASRLLARRACSATSAWAGSVERERSFFGESSGV